MNGLFCFFLVIAGFGVGYFINHRDKSQEESVRRRLKKENKELRRSMQTSQVAFESLDEKFSRQRGQLNVLQQLCDDWSSSRETAERERAQLETDLESRNARIAESENEYREEKRQRIEAEDKFHKLKEETITQCAAIEEAWREKHMAVETARQKQAVETESLRRNNGELADQLHETKARIAELNSEIESGRKLIETATANVSGLKQEYVSLESALKANTTQLKKAEAQAAKAVSEKDAALKSSAQSDQKLAVVSREAEVAKEQNAKLQSQLETATSKLDSAKQQLAKVTQQRDQMMDSEKATAVVVSGLQKRLDNQESTIHLLRQRQDDALENLKHELKVRSELESKFESRIHNEQENVRRLKDEHESELVALRESMQSDSASQIAELKDQISQQKARYQEHSSDLREQLARQHEQLSQQQNELTRQREAVEKEREALQQQQQRFNSESESMASELSLAQSEMKKRVAKLENDAVTYTESIVKLDAQKEQLKQEIEATRQQMRSQLKQDSETIGNLQRERDDLRSELEQLHAKIAPLQEQVDSHRAFETELDLTRARVVDMERELAQRSQESKRLQAQANELQRLRQRYQDANDQQKKLQLQIDELVSRQIARESHRSEQQALVNELEAKLRVSEETVADLRKERAMVLATLADQRQPEDAQRSVISFTQSVATGTRTASSSDIHEYDSEYGGRTRRDANRGLVFTETPTSCDDLKRISGIAEVLEKRLNDFGIYTFKQIMEWKPEEIEEFSRLLAFRDRIVRDDWQGQARFFYNQKRKRINAAA